MISFIQFFYNILVFPDLYCILGHRLRHGNNINLLKALLPKSRDAGILISIQLTSKKNNRKGIEISVCDS